jgi:hypothetical protein
LCCHAVDRVAAKPSHLPTFLTFMLSSLYRTPHAFQRRPAVGDKSPKNVNKQKKVQEQKKQGKKQPAEKK